MSISLLQIQNAHKAFARKQLFQGASFAINVGEHVGVIGPNGAGKSTLFKIIVGDEVLDNGEVVRSQDLRLGYLAQYDRMDTAVTIEEFVGKDSLTPIWDLRRLGQGLGLGDAEFGRNLSDLSGGYRMRAKLLRLVGQQPNLMLLDEPTNYLDLETLLVLEQFLQDFGGSFMLISHDREFLRRTTDFTLEVEAGEINKFPGNIDDYFEQKALLRTQLEQRAMSAEAKRKEVLDFAARFGAKATKARQVQSRLKMLSKMETVEVKPLAVGARIKIPEPVRTGKLSLRLRQAALGYPGKTVLTKVEAEIMTGDHVGVVGLNGAGKSTLLKSLAGALPLSAGTREVGYGVDIGYYAQHVGEALEPTASVLECLRAKAHSSLKDQEILDVAGSLLFSGADVNKKVAMLSGGEKARVALGQILLQKSPCLLLDEPTNHLDFYTVEALTQALAEYAGTVIIVSHDQGFIKRVATKILEINHGTLSTYPGTYDDYVWSLQKGILGERSGRSGPTDEKSKPPQPNPSIPKPDHRLAREEQRAKENRLKQITRRLESTESKVAAAQAELDALGVQAGDDPSNHDLLFRLAQADRSLKDHEAAWLQLSEEQEKLKAELLRT